MTYQFRLREEPFEFHPQFESDSFEYEEEFGGEFEFETRSKCKKDWCSPDYIQWVQKSLNQLRKTGTKLREDGFHDSRTLRAIQSFQKQYGLKPDGEVGPITEKVLISKGASHPPELKQLPCSSMKAETLIAKLNRYRGNIPLHILLGWIEIESGRQIGRITSLCERGFFQIYPGEAKDRGIKNHQLLSYDEDHSLQSGVKLINYFIAKTNALVKKYGLPSQGDVFWKAVKLHHWIPSGPEKILADMQAHGVKPSSWTAITSYALDPRNRGRLKEKIKRDPQQGIHNADEMLKRASAWLKKLEAKKSLSKESDGSAPGLAWEAYYGNRDEQAFELQDAMSAPTLLKCKKTSLGETLCVKIDLGINRAPNKVDPKTGKPTVDAKFFKVEPMTGIFIPQSYVPQKEVDIVLYLHGHKGAYPGNSATIDDYWNGSRFPFFALREEVNGSGKNILFVAPTLGPLSQAGNLTSGKGFDNYLAKVLAALRKHFLTKNPQQEIEKIGKIILAAHSGGGSPMLRIAELQGSSNTSKIAECWGFDSVYGNVEKRWVDWAASHRNARLFIYYYNTASRSLTLEKLSKERNLQNVCLHGWAKKDFADWAKTHPVLKKSGAGPHFWVPIVYLKERLQNAPCRAKPISSLSKSPARQREVILELPSLRRMATVQTENPSFEALSFEVDAKTQYPLTDVPLYQGKIKIASAGSAKKGNYVVIKEAPAVFLLDIIRRAREKALKDKKNAIAAKLNPDTWFRQFTRITFLGRRLKEGQYIHIEMAKLLKTIEGEFIRMLGSSSAEKTGDILLNNSKERISGSRATSSTATFSMHMLGLAVDVNYLGNPYIQSDKDINALNHVLENAALLMNTEILTYKKDVIKGNFKDRFDYVQALDTVLENYFKLLDSPGELARYLRDSRSSAWRKLTLAEAKTRIQNHLKNLAGLLARGKYKDYFKKNAILNFDKRFVAGMEAMGLHWGGHYGDMMHFDMRRAGVGYYIEKARIEYSKRVREQAMYLLKEKKYGEYTPDPYFQNIGQPVMAREQTESRQIYQI
jgi:hypothetical protein